MMGLSPEDMGIPRLYQKAKLNSGTEACRILREFLGAPPQDVFRLLLGTYGCGKTYACHAFQIRLGGHGLYYTGKRLRDLAVSEYKDELLTTTTKMPYILIIDDLGAEHEAGSGYFESVVRQIVDERYSNCMRTVITSNFNLAEFEEWYGTAVVDRIKESGKIYELTPLDFRKEKPQTGKADVKEAVRS